MNIDPNAFELFKRALERIEKENPPREERKCLFDAFFERERNKPASERVNFAHISCSCPKCSPRM